MRTYKLAAIPGDGIGKEVIAAGLEVLDTLAKRDGGFRFDVTHFDWGSGRPTWGSHSLATPTSRNAWHP